MPRGSSSRGGSSHRASRTNAPSNGRSKGNSRSSGAASRQPEPGSVLGPPFRTKEYIQQEYERQGVFIKPMWLDNPKAPLANYLGGQTGGASGLGAGGNAFVSEMGWLDGKRVCR
jgi:hypothetical protein